MKITAEVEVNAPIDSVFDVFSDIQKAEERITDIQKIEIVSDEQSGVGLRWKETRAMFGKEETVEMGITEIDEPNSYTVESEAHGAEYKSTYTFTSNGDSTRVELVFEGRAVSFGAKVMSVMFFFMKGATKKAFEKDMIDLKNFVESSK